MNIKELKEKAMMLTKNRYFKTYCMIGVAVIAIFVLFPSSAKGPEDVIMQYYKLASKGDFVGTEKLMYDRDQSHKANIEKYQSDKKFKKFIDENNCAVSKEILPEQKWEVAKVDELFSILDSMKGA